MAVAEKADPGANILCMLPDTGERYLSTPLFGEISEDMTEDEIALSKSTPNYRFDVTARQLVNLCDEGLHNDATRELHVPALLERLGQ